MHLDHVSLLEHAWKSLENGRDKRKHSFHTGTLATLSLNGPEIRTFVLRRVSREEPSFGLQADFRTPKIQEMLSEPRIAACFYSFVDKLQLRIKAEATIHHKDEIAQLAWEKVPLLSRRCYLVDPAPSMSTPEYNSGIPGYLVDREPVEEESLPGFDNFAVVHCKILEMDVLSLEYTGHRRVLYTFSSDGIESVWKVP